MSGIDPSYTAIVGAWHLPTLIIGVLAIALAVARRLPGRSRGLLIGAGATIVLGRVLSFAWYLSLPVVFSKVGVERINLITTVSTLVLAGVEVVGLALLLSAALAGRKPRGAGPDGSGSPWLGERPADFGQQPGQQWSPPPSGAGPFPGPAPGAPWGPPQSSDPPGGPGAPPWSPPSGPGELR